MILRNVPSPTLRCAKIIKAPYQTHQPGMIAAHPQWCQIIPSPARQRDHRERPSIRAAARISRSLPDRRLAVGLLFHFRNASSPGVDEPIADLCAGVSQFPTCLSNPTHLGHCETGARAEHLLLFLRGVWMSYMLLEPLFEHVGNVPRKIASSFLWRLRCHVFRLKVHGPLVTILVLMSVITWRHAIAVRR